MIPLSVRKVLAGVFAFYMGTSGVLLGSGSGGGSDYEAIMAIEQSVRYAFGIVFSLRLLRWEEWDSGFGLVAITLYLFVLWQSLVALIQHR